MKKLKLNQNQNNQKSSIQQSIFEDVNNINKFNIIIEEFIIELENNNYNKVKELYQIIKEVLEYYLNQKKDILTHQLLNFLNGKIILLLDVFLDVLDPDDNKINIIIIKCIFEFLEYVKDKSEYVIKLTNKLFSDDELIFHANIIKIVSKRLNTEYLYIFLKTLSECEIKNSICYYNIYNLIVSIYLNDIETKRIYQRIIIKFINDKLFPNELLLNLLLNLNKIIFSNLDNPLILSDYLIDVYENNIDIDIKILSLSGLFVLITKYKLDYSCYYNILYKTLGITKHNNNQMLSIFDSKYKSRYIKILDLSLKNPSVPIVVIISFIKKLARMSLKLSSSTIAIILNMIQNLIKQHPKSLILLIRKRNKVNCRNDLKESSKFINSENNNDITEESETFEKETEGYPKYDQFDENEADPYKTRAEYSCLWELYTLKQHFCYKIRSIVHRFESNFMKSKENIIDDLIDMEEDDLLYELSGSHFYISSEINQIELLYNNLNIII